MQMAQYSNYVGAKLLYVSNQFFNNFFLNLFSLDQNQGICFGRFLQLLPNGIICLVKGWIFCLQWRFPFYSQQESECYEIRFFHDLSVCIRMWAMGIQPSMSKNKQSKDYLDAVFQFSTLHLYVLSWSQIYNLIFQHIHLICLW